MLEEFADFRHAKKLTEYIIHINSLEEESDRLFIANMRQLHVEPGLDNLEIMAWEEIYTYLEKCADACEEIADSVENVVMKNSYSRSNQKGRPRTMGPALFFVYSACSDPGPPGICQAKCSVWSQVSAASL